MKKKARRLGGESKGNSKRDRVGRIEGGCGRSEGEDRRKTERKHKFAVG